MGNDDDDDEDKVGTKAATCATSLNISLSLQPNLPPLFLMQILMMMVMKRVIMMMTILMMMMMRMIDDEDDCASLQPNYQMLECTHIRSRSTNIVVLKVLVFVSTDDYGSDDVMMRVSIKFVKVHNLFSVFPCGGSSIQIENRGIQQPDPGDFNQRFSENNTNKSGNTVTNTNECKSRNTTRGSQTKLILKWAWGQVKIPWPTDQYQVDC